MVKKSQITPQKITTHKPSVCIVGCLHGDEIIGKKVIEALGKLEIKKGNILTIIANPQALLHKKRYIDQDLNRSFPGDVNGNAEQKIASRLLNIIKGYDLVVDIHATNSNIDNLAIITKLNKGTKAALKFLPIQKIAIVKQKVFGGHELISHCRVGISLEYGPDKSGHNYKLALQHVIKLLIGLGMVAGTKKYYRNKILYTVSGRYTVDKKFQQNATLNDFKLIKKGQIIGHMQKNIIKSDKTFYPLFLGKGHYEETLALVAKEKKSLIL